MKILLVFQSVGDTLYNHPTLSREIYDKFLIELTVAYEYDYVEVKTTNEYFTFLADLHTSLEKKSERKDLFMGDMYVAAKGAKLSKKATLEGFTDENSKYWVSILMSIPGVSETKAIAIAKVYPTFKKLVAEFKRHDLSDKQKRTMLSEVEVEFTAGDEKVKRVGKKIAERIYETLCSVVPDQLVD